MRRTLEGELQPLLSTVREDGHPWGVTLDRGRLGSAEDSRRRVPGSPNRWSGGRSGADWVPLRPGAVVEVTCENVSNHRFRHPARFVRWRLTRNPSSADRPARHPTPPEFHELFE
ncbi:MAG: hypothetical protein R2716_08310 [Microthrixaceae bacterium]